MKVYWSKPDDGSWTTEGRSINLRWPWLARLVARILNGITLVLLAACGGDGGAPRDADLNGTWIGTYTNTNAPGIVYQGVLQLDQTGDQVAGTLTTNAGRAATVTGEVGETEFTATFTYTDVCQGTAESTADITEDGTVLTGNYTSEDCLGSTSGGYVLEKQ